MSRETPIDNPQPSSATDTVDPLLAALRQLPPLAVSGSAALRVQEQARASYTRTFERSESPLSALGLVGRAAVPVLLAGTVGLYMTWAVNAAAALLR